MLQPTQQRCFLSGSTYEFRSEWVLIHKIWVFNLSINSCKINKKTIWEWDSCLFSFMTQIKSDVWNCFFKSDQQFLGKSKIITNLTIWKIKSNVFVHWIRDGQRKITVWCHYLINTHLHFLILSLYFLVFGLIGPVKRFWIFSRDMLLLFSRIAYSKIQSRWNTKMLQNFALKVIEPAEGLAAEKSSDVEFSFRICSSILTRISFLPVDLDYFFFFKKTHTD